MKGALSMMPENTPSLRLRDKVSYIQQRLRLITNIHINQLLLLEQRFTEDFEDIQQQLKQLEEMIGVTTSKSEQQ